MPQISLVYDTYDAVDEPADDAETVIAILNQVSTINPFSLVHLRAWVAIAVDADATGAVLLIRRGTIAGDIVGGGGGAVSFVAGDAPDVECSVEVVDSPGDLASATYVLTLTLADAGGPSTFSGLHLEARV